eukprot:Opistho-2@86395
MDSTTPHRERERVCVCVYVHRACAQFVTAPITPEAASPSALTVSTSLSICARFCPRTDTTAFACATKLASRELSWLTAETITADRSGSNSAASVLAAWSPSAISWCETMTSGRVALRRPSWSPMESCASPSVCVATRSSVAVHSSTSCAETILRDSFVWGFGDDSEFVLVEGTIDCLRSEVCIITASCSCSIDPIARRNFWKCWERRRRAALAGSDVSREFASHEVARPTRGSLPAGGSVMPAAVWIDCIFSRLWRKKRYRRAVSSSRSIWGVTTAGVSVDVDTVSRNARIWDIRLTMTSFMRAIYGSFCPNSTKLARF